jgi:hypothetical protein
MKRPRVRQSSPTFLMMSALCVSLSAIVSSAQVSVTVDHIENDQATAEFKFKTAPSPLKDSAAALAKFSLSAGSRDDASGDLAVLHDGKLPAGEDEPAANFFFQNGTDGGRIVLTFAGAIDVKQINTFSWHSNSRAAQVYDLYGAGEAGKGFNPAPSKGIDPVSCGWRLIAKVDTRPKDGQTGGQYGVSISDSKGSLGKFRYLLLAVYSTETKDPFGNTFYSEIDVVDDAELIGDRITLAPKQGVKLVQIDNGKYSVAIDTSETPELTGWADTELTPVVKEWYPKLVEMLPSPGYSAPTHFSITFRKDKHGVADTSGNRINCAASWFEANLQGEAKGAIVHEMTHVVQRYYGFGRQTHPNAAPNPGWLVEGLCDYIRWYKFEPTPAGAVISRRGLTSANYDRSYRITANFLNWATTKYDKDLIKELNTAMREGHYTDALFKTRTGKSIDALNEEWKADLAKSFQPASGPSK